MRRLYGSRQNARLRGLRRRRRQTAVRSAAHPPVPAATLARSTISNNAKAARLKIHALAVSIKNWSDSRLFQAAHQNIASIPRFAGLIFTGVQLKSSVVGRNVQSAVAGLVNGLAAAMVIFATRLVTITRVLWASSRARLNMLATKTGNGIRRLLHIPTHDRLPDIPGGDPLTFGVVVGSFIVLVALGALAVIDLSGRITEEPQFASLDRSGPVRPPVIPSPAPTTGKSIAAVDLETETDTQWLYAYESQEDDASVAAAVADPMPKPAGEVENLAAASPLLVMPEARPEGLVVPGPDVALIPMEPEPALGAARSIPPWLANAVTVRKRKGPMIAIVIDDAGVAQQRTARAIDLPPPLTIAFIPYSRDLERQTRLARRRGHELMLHIPMEPGSAFVDPGPNALLTSVSEQELMRRLRWAMSQFDGYVGINNHMGSKFTARADLMQPLLTEMNHRGYLFLDSRTDHRTQGARLARDMGMPHASRDVFLDNDLDREKIEVQLAQVERIARRKGHAIAIGHPHDVTVDVLARWIPQARARGFNFVPVSEIVKQEYGPRLAAISASGEPEGLLGGAQ